MKTYKEFHGEMPITEIGKMLRLIVKNGENFKILTGYGSLSGSCKSKNQALKCLAKMKKEGLIKGYLPGGLNILSSNSPYLDDKLKYYNLIKNDVDYNNDGIIFIFVK